MNMNMNMNRNMRRNMTLNSVAVAVAFGVMGSLLAGLATAHSFMLEPSCDNTMVEKRHCRRGPLSSDNCGGPCISMDSWQYNESAPVTEWKRGSKKRVRWARNNHVSGFVRLSLVPVEQRDSMEAHEKHAFHYTCFETGERKCDSDKYYCGTDTKVYETKIKVPKVKDGVYVLGWAWYGGFARGSRGEVNLHFGDYYSCAYIRIKGGKKSKKKLQKPKFKPKNKEKRCMALANERGVCKIEPCPKAYVGAEPELMCPKGFKWKKSKCRWSKKRGKKGGKGKKSKSKSRKKKSKGRKDKDKGRGKKGTKKKAEKYGKDGKALPVSGAATAIAVSDESSSEKVDCGCSVRKGDTPYIGTLLISRLDKNGRRIDTKCLCGGTVNLEEYAHGFTILAHLVGEASPVRFFVDGHVERTERYAPYAIAGDTGGVFNRCMPPIGRSIWIEAQVKEERYGVKVRFVRR